MSFIVRRVLVILAHQVLWGAAIWAAFALRFDLDVPASYRSALWVWMPLLLVMRIAAFQHANLFSGIWRYTGARDLIAIGYATTLSTAAFAAALLAAGQTSFPRAVFAIEWLVALVAVGGARFAIRMVPSLLPAMAPARAEPQLSVRLLVVGAGDAGEMLTREIQKAHRDRYEVVGFVDDDRRKRGNRIHGVRVFGPVAHLTSIAADLGAEEIVIAIPTATGAQMRRIVEFCRASGLRFRTIPGIDHLIDGKVRVSQLRNVAMEDLLGREPVVLDTASIAATIKGRVVLVTGAGGSIGSEICRQVCRFRPSLLVLVERSENALFEIHRELERTFPGVRTSPCVADIGERARMLTLLQRYRPAVLFHAAAHKHVPMMEHNPGEAVKNNVLATRSLADLAHSLDVERFVMISTDKAVNPTSVMGVSKRVAEIYVQALAQRSRTKFVTVRFGNVLGSAGSVLPVFKEQIANGGPVTVTHPEMQRYFMTIPEASQLVLQAAAMGKGGEIFVLDMGAPVRIADLARDLITLSGLEPDEDIEIRFTGIRPGEKLYEELYVPEENCERTGHPKIFIGRSRPQRSELLEAQLQALAEARDDSPDRIRRAFADIVPEYRHARVEPAPAMGRPVAALVPLASSDMSSADDSPRPQLPPEIPDELLAANK